MKLELKHLAAYLPYKVMCLNQHLPDVEFVKEELIGISNHFVWCGVFNAIHGSNHVPVSAIKPILYPLDYLTSFLEEIYKGLKFKNFEIIEKEFAIYVKYQLIGDIFTDLIYTQGSFDYCPMYVFEKLLDKKFDVFNLIENNLAIAVTENFNPYK